MRRVFAIVAVTATLMAGLGGQAWAEPPDPPGAPSVPGVRLVDGHTLTWTSPTLVAGNAAIEFWAAEKLLGRPTTTDHRTFRLVVDQPPKPDDLQVRAGGRRLDGPPPAQGSTEPLPAPPPAAAAAVDPGVPGTYRTVSGEYTLDPVRLSGYPKPVEMQAVVVAPEGAPGARPLALFLHGRHFTCYRGVEIENVTLDWPCPSGAATVPSHRGYLEAQRLLASQGYVTVSISANGINAQDNVTEDAGAQARSSLVRMHLDRWATWSGTGRPSAPPAVRAAPPADLSRVLLVGHSRGGEGVNRAAMDSLTPPPAGQDDYLGTVRWTIRGTLLIGPTVFGHNPVPDVPSATLLPGCDGDVSDLQGQMYVDATTGVSSGRALHSALFMVGANHNYFNTEWTPGQAVAPAYDDFPKEAGDPVCTPGKATRLTAAQQQKAGATYIAAAARLFVDGDDQVRPLLDGTGVRAPSADPARVLSHAIGGARTPLVIPEEAITVTGAGRLCAEVTDDRTHACIPPPTWLALTPHFVSFAGLNPEPGRRAVAMEWSAAGQTVTVRPPRAVPVTGAVTMRIAVPPNTTNRFGVAVTDDGGKRTELGDVQVDGLPGSTILTQHWGQEVRVPLASPQSVAQLELVPRTATGKAWLLDAWGWQPGTPDPQPTGLPRIDVGSLTPVQEGDSGTRTHQVPVSVTGSGSGQVRVFVTDAVTWDSQSWLATVTPETRSIPIPIPVAGNTRFSGDRGYPVSIKVVDGLVIGDYGSTVKVVEDDPLPTVAVTTVTDSVTEGGTLTWRLTLSTTADTDLYMVATPVPLSGTPELSSSDVDPEWFRAQAFEDPAPSRQLSGTNLRPRLRVPAGQLTVDLTVPTVADGVSEPAEQVRFELTRSGHGDALPLGTVTGKVTD
jgi:hypothetical protein